MSSCYAVALVYTSHGEEMSCQTLAVGHGDLPAVPDVLDREEETLLQVPLALIVVIGGNGLEPDFR